MIRYAEQVPPFMELLAEPSFQQKYGLTNKQSLSYFALGTVQRLAFGGLF